MSNLKALFLSDKISIAKTREPWVKKHYPEFYSEIIQWKLDSDLDQNLTWSQALWLYLHDLESPPTCKLCSSRTKWQSFNVGWRETCSPKCASTLSSQKVKETCLQKYGVENVSQLESVKNQKKETTLNNHGVEYPQQAKHIRAKTKATVKERLGHENYFSYLNQKNTEEYQEKVQKYSDPIKVVRFEDARVLLQENGKEYYLTKKEIYYRMLNDETLSQSLNKKHRSRGENQVFEYISGLYGNEIQRNNRIENIEFDLILPGKKLAIEFNGLYWHSSKFKDKKYHLKKLELANAHNLQLFNIWEDDWKYKKNIIKDLLNRKLGLSKSLGARKFKVAEVSTAQSNSFLESYHLQGKAGGKVKIGLWKDGELYQLIVFGKPRFNKNYQWELVRMATKAGYHIIGGSERLISHFISAHGPQSIVSYADRSVFTGNSYSRMGFQHIGNTDPGFWWTNGNMKLNRMTFQKHKLPPSDLTVAQQMEKQGYYQLWDCGQAVFSIEESSSR